MVAILTILEDTRQQESKHEAKHKYFKENNILYRRVALDCGDYTLPNDRSVAIDTKKDLQELIGDIQCKTIGKGEAKKMVLSTLEGYPKLNPMEAYHIITDSDEGDRFPEGELEMWCNTQDISDASRKALKKILVKFYGFFHRGLKRAQNNATRLIILVETQRGIDSIEDVERLWINPRAFLWRKKVMSKYGIAYRNFDEEVSKLNAAGAGIRGPMDGPQLAKAMRTMEQNYGCKFMFCRKNDAGRVIINILTGGDAE